MEELTDLIYDTLMGNTQFPQLDINKIENPWCDAAIGLIHFEYNNEFYQLKLTKHFK